MPVGCESSLLAQVGKTSPILPRIRIQVFHIGLRVLCLSTSLSTTVTGGSARMRIDGTMISTLSGPGFHQINRTAKD
ncbi:MAG: hypothetical protein ABI656_06770 [bacterium]